MAKVVKMNECCAIKGFLTFLFKFSQRSRIIFVVREMFLD